MESSVYKQNEIVWLSVLQGFAMLLVVIGHVFHGEASFSWEYGLQNVIYSFHMPLFMCISGYLFYVTAIKKQKNFGKILKAKATRIVVPYFVLSLLTLCVKAPLSAYMRRSAEFSLSQLIDTFILCNNNPLGEMWFLNVLFFLFLFYPIFIWADKSKVKEACIMVFFIATFFIREMFHPEISAFVFDFEKAMYYGVFFYGGVMLYKYGMSMLRNLWLIMPFVFAFAILKTFACSNALTAFVVPWSGIFVFFYLAKLVAPKIPGLFSSFRNYTYQIFLLGIFPQMGVRFFIKWLTAQTFAPSQGICTIAMYLLSIVCGIYIPVFIAKLVQKMDLAAIKISLGLR